MPISSLVDDENGGGDTDVAARDGDSSTPSHGAESKENRRLYITAIEYTTDSGTPITHLFCRDEDGQKYHLRVDGHEPSFFIKRDAYTNSLENHYAVKRVTAHDSNGNAYTDLDGNELARVYTYLPKQVSDLRDNFEQTYEADVFYANRWLIDNDVYTAISVDEGVFDDANPKGQRGEDGVVESDLHVNDIEPAESCDADPRVVTVDIEVGSEANEVPDTDLAQWPITSIVAHDSYTDEYRGWLLVDEQQPATPLPPDVCDEYQRFHDESTLLTHFNEWIGDRHFDIFTGWFSNSFDYPYLINRCRQLNAYSYQQWSPLGDVWVTNGRGEPVIKGCVTFDMLDGYEKTQIHELDSKALEDVASKELGYGKEAVEDGYTEMWRSNPTDFLRYNKVDVELVVELNESESILELYRALRRVSGAQYDDCHAPIDMLDVMFLREAKDAGMRLPTAEAPEDGWFYGGYVFDMDVGIHEHCLYPDVASEYPSMITMCNISPETIIGTQADLEASEYDESDCYWSYIDTRPDSIKKESDPEYERVYYVKPSIREGFVSSVVSRIMVLTEETSGKRREALKRTRNGVWGYLGDSDSYSTGSRLFDKQMAESITLGSRKCIQYAGERFVDNIADDDAKLIAGDTDSVVTSVPSAESGEQALQWGFDATDATNEDLEDFCVDTFGLDSTADSDIVLELEDYSERMFMGDAKKRYVTLESWNDSLEPCGSHDDPVTRCEQCQKTGWLDPPELSVKGYEYVRSDVATVTKEAQEYVFEAIMRHSEGRAKELCYNYVGWLVNAIRDAADSRSESAVEATCETSRDGDYPIGKIGNPSGIGQPLDEYGSPSRTPQPIYRGARYANECVYEGEVISKDDKPLLYYLNGMGGDYQSTYPSTWDVKGGGRKVDAIAVQDATDLPDEADVDVETMITKVVQKPLERIFEPLGWSFEDAVLDGTQMDITTFM